MGTRTPKLSVTPEEIEQYKIAADALQRYRDAAPAIHQYAKMTTGGAVDNRDALLNVTTNVAPVQPLKYTPHRAYHSAYPQPIALNSITDTVTQRITGLQNYAKLGRGEMLDTADDLSARTTGAVQTKLAHLKNALTARDTRRELLGELAGAGFSYLLRDAGTGAGEMDTELRKKLGVLLTK